MASNICVGPQGRIQVASALEDEESDVCFGASEPVVNKTEVPIVAPSPNVIMHPVTIADTLFALAIRYDTSVEAIKRANDVSDIHLCPPGTLLKVTVGKAFPGKEPEALPPTEAQIRRDAVKQLTAMLSFSEGVEVSKEEVEFYLKSHDWDVTSAMKERKEDKEWGRKNGDKKKPIPQKR